MLLKMEAAMKNYIQNAKGLTLVEILAALVILGILLISFSSFFLQSAKNTKYNEEKLTAIDLSEEIVADIRRNPEMYKDLKVYIYNETPSVKAIITVEEGPTERLRKANINVIPSNNSEIKHDFMTEIFFEVSL